MKTDIVVVGSLNADLVAHVPRFPTPGETVRGSELAVFPGGKGANQACAAARFGGRVHMLGRIGADANGELLRQSLAHAGVETAAVLSDDSAVTGTALITIDAAGQNEIVVVPGANGKLSPEDVESQRQLIAGAGYVLLQLEVPLDAVETAARLAHEAGAVVILDPAPVRAEAASLLPLADYVTPNETELRQLVAPEPPASDAAAEEELARQLLAMGARCVIAKLGAEGARLVSPDTVHHWPGMPVEAVDTTAAGDVWNGAFAVGLAAGLDPVSAGDLAGAAAAVSVTRRGAQPSMPTRAEVVAFLAGRHKR